MAAAIQLKRQDMDPVVVEREALGGLLRNACLIENYPGFPEGISGTELVERFKRHLAEFNIQVVYEEAEEVFFEDERYIVKLKSRSIRARFLIIATGTKPRKLDNLDVSEELEDNIFYEIIPIMDVEGKEIAVIGSGDAAFDYALSLSRKNKVTIFNRGEKVKCLPLLQRRCMRNGNIRYLRKAEVCNLKKKNSKLILFYRQGRVKSYGCDFLVAAIGRVPCLDIFDKEFINQQKESETLFMVGDVKNGFYRQTALSVGDGVKAAMMIRTKRKELLNESICQNRK